MCVLSTGWAGDGVAGVLGGNACGGVLGTVILGSGEEEHLPAEGTLGGLGMISIRTALRSELPASVPGAPQHGCYK